jgi:hypothetical protein
LYDLNAWRLEVEVGYKAADGWVTRARFEVDGTEQDTGTAVVQVDEDSWREEVWDAVNEQLVDDGTA